MTKQEMIDAETNERCALMDKAEVFRRGIEIAAKLTCDDIYELSVKYARDCLERLLAVNKKLDGE